MNEQVKEVKRECDKYMYRHNLESEYEISVIYYNPNNIRDSFAYIMDRNSNEEIKSFEPFSDDEPQQLAEWDYNIDTYDFDNLQNGYEIAYMPLDHHYNFWCVLEQWMPDDIDNVEGLQKYLDYCKHHGITKEVIETTVGLSLEEDAMQYYTEKNQGYTIIAECTINGKSIVLAENHNAPSPYAIWLTTPTRKNGFNDGHYLSSIKEGTKDYANRSKQQLQYAIGAQVDLSIKHKKEEER